MAINKKTFLKLGLFLVLAQSGLFLSTVNADDKISQIIENLQKVSAILEKAADSGETKVVLDKSFPFDVIQANLVNEGFSYLKTIDGRIILKWDRPTKSAQNTLAQTILARSKKAAAEEIKYDDLSATEAVQSNFASELKMMADTANNQRYAKEEKDVIADLTSRAARGETSATLYSVPSDWMQKELNRQGFETK